MLYFKWINPIQHYFFKASGSKVKPNWNVYVRSNLSLVIGAKKYCFINKKHRFWESFGIAPSSALTVTLDYTATLWPPPPPPVARTSQHHEGEGGGEDRQCCLVASAAWSTAVGSGHGSTAARCHLLLSCSTRGVWPGHRWCGATDACGGQCGDTFTVSTEGVGLGGWIDSGLNRGWIDWFKWEI